MWVVNTGLVVCGTGKRTGEYIAALQARALGLSGPRGRRPPPPLITKLCGTGFFFQPSHGVDVVSGGSKASSIGYCNWLAIAGSRLVTLGDSEMLTWHGTGQVPRIE
jgi:hypothetical protein